MTRKGTLHLFIGPVGAGKTTYGQRRAARIVGVFLDLDVWMVRLFGSDSRPQDKVIEWYLERRERCRGLLWDVALEVLRSGVDVVLEFGLVTVADREATLSGVESAAPPPEHLRDGLRPIRQGFLPG